MRLPIALSAIAALTLTSAAVQAQIPSDIRSKMDGYVGTWRYQESVRETPSGPETAQTGSWQARWIYDSLIEWTGSDSADGFSSIEYEGYDPATGNYTFWFGSDGSRGQLFNGKWEGNTLRIDFVEFTPNGDMSRGRCTWPYSSDFSSLANYTCERLTEGRWWVFRQGTARKTR